MGWRRGSKITQNVVRRGLADIAAGICALVHLLWFGAVGEPGTPQVLPVQEALGVRGLGIFDSPRTEQVDKRRCCVPRSAPAKEGAPTLSGLVLAPGGGAGLDFLGRARCVRRPGAIEGRGVAWSP